MRLLLAAALVSAVCYSATRPRIDLNGAWEFRTDPKSVGDTQEWHSPGVPFDRRLQVPGTWQAQGVGEPSGIVRNHYEGQAWYRRQVAIPASWKGKTVHVRVGGALRRVALYVNGHRIGEHDGISAPFEFDVTQAIRPGSENTIAFRIVNPGATINEGPRTQPGDEPTGMVNYIASWGGLYGNVELEASDPLRISEVAIVPSIERKTAAFRVSVAGADSVSGVRVEVNVGGATGAGALRGGEAEVTVTIPEARLWTPEDPHLYTATVRLVQGSNERDRMEERFGMREVTTRGNVLLLNGKPLYLRGYGDDMIEVLTGAPPASKQVYLERLRMARGFGFNAVRFHSATPLPAFFEAADEVGIFIMAELPVAYTQYFLPHRDFLKREMEGVLRAYRNSPSFLSLALGNEFNLDWLKTEAERKEFQASVEEFYRLAKSIDPRRLILSNDGLVLRPTDMFSLYNGAPEDAPTVRHEFGSYYCSLPDISLIPKFTGVIEPTWLKEKKAWVEESGLTAKYAEYVRNSQRLQHIGRKYQIERVRRSPEVTGYHYWLIVDYPGGTGEGDSWEEGWFDYFWQPKGIQPAEGRELNSPVLLLLSAGVNERTLWNDTEKVMDVFVSNYGNTPVKGGVLRWRLFDGMREIAAASVAGGHSELGTVAKAGRIRLPPAGGEEARKLQLVAEITAGPNTYTNRWNFWTFPRKALLDRSPVPVASGVRWTAVQRLYPFITDAAAGVPADSLLIVPRLDAGALQHIESGGRVWLMADREQFGRPGDATFFPASGGALGSVLQNHAALKGMPHEGMFDLQFYNLVEGGWSLPLDDWPRELVPIAGGIRTTSSFLSKRKNLSRTGYIFEAKAGRGSLLVTALTIREHLDEAYPEAVFLFDRLLRYASGSEFRPAVEVSVEFLRKQMAR
ncbi:MAG: hypothetical protein LC130_11655 [Bryobacterales bacterium]|nr:hypothetical protein [Bryobacterales bacterium]MEB2360288.1 hypothetical protein [Bryobacterales bacterium]